MGGIETKKRIRIGGMWEFSRWNILFDVKVSQFAEVYPCYHCHSQTIKKRKNAWGQEMPAEWEWICPRVVEQYNEGGYATTGVCLDCILDASKELN